MASDETGTAGIGQAKLESAAVSSATIVDAHLIRRRLAGFAGFLGVLSLAFLGPLLDLVRLALASDFDSYVLLVPFVSLYLSWLRRTTLSAEPARSWKPAVGAAICGSLILSGRWLVWRPATAAGASDFLWLYMLAYVSFVWAGAFIFLGSRAVREFAFPLGFLFFMAPMPGWMKAGLEQFLQHGSAEAAYVLLKMSGSPVLRDGLIFQLPNLTLEVAPQCSGIRSSYVLFMASLVAGHMFLRSTWKKGLLALLVLPLGILRNAFRILTIAMLTIHVDPGIIHGPIHKRGGPIFFVLSLVPLFLILILLRRSERARD